MLFLYFQEVLLDFFNDIFDDLDEHEGEGMGIMRLPRIVPRDRSDPMAYLTDREFVQRFRLSKAGVRDLLQEIRPHLRRIRNGRGKPITFRLMYRYIEFRPILYVFQKQ